MKRPSFGEKKDVTYDVRNGVYIVILNETNDQIKLVQAPNGAYFLPGGEIEGAETQLEALERELLEELGYTVKAPRYLGAADEYFYSSHRNKYFYNPGFFYFSAAYEKVAQPLEDFNQVGWFPIATAQSLLKRGSHKWAVEQVQNARQAHFLREN